MGSVTDPQELENAQCRFFYLVQHESFPTEKTSLLKGSPLNSTSKILQFSPFIGPQGLLRATGRTKRLEVSNFDAKHPVLLDSRHPVIRLFLEHLLRAALRTVVSKCVTCRKRRADTINPIMADLPRERLASREPPFTNTGIDYFGPFYVSVKRSTEKRWSFLFTCLTTRAVPYDGHQ